MRPEDHNYRLTALETLHADHQVDFTAAASKVREGLVVGNTPLPEQRVGPTRLSSLPGARRPESNPAATAARG